MQNALRSFSGSALSLRKNCGRKRKTTPRQGRLLKAAVVRSPHASSARVAESARCQGIQVSARTVRKRLTSQFNLVARRPAKKPLMTEKQRLARVRCCKEMSKKTADWWDQVMFTDESTFTQVRGSGSNYVRRPPGER